MLPDTIIIGLALSWLILLFIKLLYPRLRRNWLQYRAQRTPDATATNKTKSQWRVAAISYYIMSWPLIISCFLTSYSPVHYLKRAFGTHPFLGLAIDATLIITILTAIIPKTKGLFKALLPVWNEPPTDEKNPALALCFFKGLGIAIIVCFLLSVALDADYQLAIKVWLEKQLNPSA